MDSNNLVGIYLSLDHAVVVGVRVKGQDCRILGTFVASVDPESEDRVQLLAKQIADGCAENKLRADEAVVALDCALYMQHAVHSEFKQSKQIAATIRFDTEEVLATDVSDLGVAFQVDSEDDHGSQLHVFTAEQDVLAAWLLALQSHGIDPVAIVPDICCLGRYIQNYAETEELEKQPLYSVLSERHGYFVKLEQGKAAPVRAFIISPHASRTDLLQREAFTTLATLGGQTDHSLWIHDTQDQADAELLQERLGLDADRADWFRTKGTGPQAQADEADPVDYAIAMGAALLKGDRGHLANFRDDFMPFQGRRLRLQGALKWASISVTILLLALGAYLQIRVFLVKGDKERIQERVADQYSVAMPGRKFDARVNPVKKLEHELRRIDATQGGQSSGDSIPDRLTMVLTAFNAVAKASDLRIETLDVGEKTISVIGNTDRSPKHLTLMEGLRKNGLEIKRESVSPDPASGRMKFTFNLEPKRK